VRSGSRAATWLLVLAGTLNLLNRTYGHSAPGVGSTTIGTNIVMSVFAAIAGIATASVPQRAFVVVESDNAVFDIPSSHQRMSFLLLFAL
jgi:hypothetical protein